MSAPVLIDDQDPSIQKTGSWVAGGSPEEYKLTVTYTLADGPVLVVPFTGTKIGVYGTYDFSSGGVVTSYSIDGQQSETVNHKASANGKDIYKAQFWESADLSSGSHKLTVTMVKTVPQADSEGTVWFDYFQVENNLAAVVSPSGSSSGSPSPTVAGTPPSNSSSPTPSHTSTGHKDASSASAKPSSTPAPAKSSNTGAIIGGVVVGLLAVLAITGLYLFYRNRKKRKDIEAILEKPNFDYLPPPPVPYNSTPQTPNSGYPFLSNAVSSTGPIPHTQYTSPNGLLAPPPGAGFATPPMAQASNPRSSIGSTAGLSYIGAMAAGLAYDEPAQSEPYTSPPTSIAGSSMAGGRALTVANSNHGDSVAELKQRAKEAMIAEQNQLKQQYPIHPVQHVDSGIRSYVLNVEPAEQMELPPVYSAS